MRCPARSSACLSNSWLQANRALLQAIELLHCSARFLAFRLSFPPSRRAALRMPRLTTRPTSRSSRSSQPRHPTTTSLRRAHSLLRHRRPPNLAPEWFTQALSSLQSQLAETRSAASEAVATTEMLSTDVCQLKRSSVTSSAPPPKLPKPSWITR